MTTVLIGCAVAAVLLVFSYTLGMWLESAGTVHRPAGEGGSLVVVFVVPCLNEERVVGATVDRLTALCPPDGLVVVVDDGSDDATAEVVEALPDPRVRLLRRRPPDARRGKGEALNHAFRYLLESGALAGTNPHRVVVCLCDADGRLDVDALAAVLPHFADPDVGAAQVAVRIRNRGDSLLAYLQDMEFVLYTHVFQRTRGRFGAAGLGGNGQFVRLSALLTLGERPWSHSLTEDLDLGVRLVLAGWRSRYVATAAVHQQGLVSLRRLARQRSRWFQGHLQAWRLVPAVVARARGRVAADLLHLLLSPALVLVGSLMTVSLAASLVAATVSATARAQLVRPLPVGSWYLLTFAPALLFGPLYARVTGEVGRLRGLLYGHLFVLYGLLWLVAGWWGLARAGARRRSWLKTERVAEEPAAPTRRAPQTGEPARSGPR
jgi:cellulose synthase/poly-beta-1,6-N-acetylglucosamine synthase-like glycosyltransferase